MEDCPVCLEPVTTPAPGCGRHIVCLPCANRMAFHRHTVCPVCRLPPAPVRPSTPPPGSDAIFLVRDDDTPAVVLHPEEHSDEAMTLLLEIADALPPNEQEDGLAEIDAYARAKRWREPPHTVFRSIPMSLSPHVRTLYGVLAALELD